MLRRVTLAALLLLLVLAATATARTDFARQAFDVLPPGASGSLPPDANSTDQMALYDALTPLGGHVTAGDLRRLFLSERFGVQGRVARVESTGRRGLRLVRDSHNVAHVFGRTRADVMFGSGWVAGEDRHLLLDQGRGPARLAAIDVPGVNAFGLLTSLRTFVPSRQADAFVARQVQVLVRAGAPGREVLRDLDAWLAGVNAWYRRNEPSAPRFTRTDAIAGFAFIGSIFGNGGGNEVRNADLLARLRQQLGVRGGDAVFRDLREADDPEAPTTISTRFPYATNPAGPTAASPVIDPGSLSLAQAASSPPRMSNFLLVGANRSADGHPLAVMGPQLGYFYPEIVMQIDLHGGGIDAAGSAAPIAPWVFIGRGKDFAWSLTSATNDNTDEFLERLCGGDGKHYLYRGRCRAMTFFDAGTLKGAGGQPDRELTFYETVHGPVVGTATVNGRPYAVARDRSGRGREPHGMLAEAALDSGRVHSPQTFFQAANQYDTTFNWGYLDDRNVAYFSSGLLPRRAPGVNPSLPTLGDGRHDWRGFLSLAQHPHAANPPGGLLLNWNNKPAPGWVTGDDNFSYGSEHRVKLFRGFGRRMRLADVASVMNRAATQDFRAVELWPTIRRVLGATAPDPRTGQAAGLIDAWVRGGASRLDRNLDGSVDDPGAAVLDASFEGLATAVLHPVLGGLADDGGLFTTLHKRDEPPYRSGGNGSSFGSGWYGYVDKDLRTILGLRVRGRFSRVYCGNGNLVACRDSLWAAVKAGADQLAATQGPDPTAWRSDANAERIHFVPRLIPDSMRWTNRPTFQQAIEFDGHR
jgi:Penicillin amidase